MFIWDLYEPIKFSSFFIRIIFNKIQPLIAKFDQTFYLSIIIHISGNIRHVKSNKNRSRKFHKM